MKNLIRHSLTYVPVFVVILLLLTACATTTKDIKIDAASNPKTDINGYKTYAWLGSGAALNDPNGQWEPLKLDLDGELKYLINREMNRRGMTLVKPENADVLVTFLVAVNMAAEQLKKDPESKVEILENIPKGALVVALLDPKTGYAIWAGSASGEVQQDRSPDKVKERLDYAVSQMFKKLD